MIDLLSKLQDKPRVFALLNNIFSAGVTLQCILNKPATLICRMYFLVFGKEILETLNAITAFEIPGNLEFSKIPGSTE